MTPYQRIRVLLALISARFDYNASVATHMPIELWSAAQKEVDQLIDIVATDSCYTVEEVTPEYDETAERTPEDEEGGVVRVRGSIISFVDRLDDEFTKSLQNIDPHGTEYIERLKDERYLYATITRAQTYYEKSKTQGDSLTRVIMRRLEHIYSKVCSSHSFLWGVDLPTDFIARRRCQRVGGLSIEHGYQGCRIETRNDFIIDPLTMRPPLQVWKFPASYPGGPVPHIPLCPSQRLPHLARYVAHVSSPRVNPLCRCPDSDTVQSYRCSTWPVRV